MFKIMSKFNISKKSMDQVHPAIVMGPARSFLLSTGLSLQTGCSGE